MRSAAVIVFVSIVAAVAVLCALTPTVARGKALADTLIEVTPTLEAMTCDDEVPIRIDGAKFGCRARFKNGDVVDYTFAMNREGRIQVVDHGPTQAAPRIKKTSDPWGD
jgi:hypothetical protein